MRLVVAGTFGPLHDGHRRLFEHALRFGSEIVIALTSDALAVETRAEPRPIPPFSERVTAVRTALTELDQWGHDIDADCEIVELTDTHGIAVSDPTLEALVCSPETIAELEEINDRRRARGFEPLSGIVAPYTLADDGTPLSSTRLVRGEIDAHGRLLE